MEEILTIKRVANILELSDRTVGDSVRNGELRAYKQFGKWYVLKSDLVAFIKQGKTKHRKPEKIDFSVFNESSMLDKQIEADKEEKPVKAIKSTDKQPNTSFCIESYKEANKAQIEAIQKLADESPLDTEFTRTVGRYPEAVVFMLSDAHKSIPKTSKQIGIGTPLLKKIRTGMTELNLH